MVLHIIVHSDDQISLRIIQSRHDRVVLTKILSQIDPFYIGIFLCERMNRTPGIISGIVVHQYKLAFISIQFPEFLNSKLHNFSNSLF